MPLHATRMPVSPCPTDHATSHRPWFGCRTMRCRTARPPRWERGATKGHMRQRNIQEWKSGLGRRSWSHL